MGIPRIFEIYLVAGVVQVGFCCSFAGLMSAKHAAFWANRHRTLPVVSHRQIAYPAPIQLMRFLACLLLMLVPLAAAADRPMCCLLPLMT